MMIGTTENLISKARFRKLITKDTVVKCFDAGSCNIIRFQLAGGDILEIESITEDGIPSMVFYRQPAKLLRREANG